MPRSTEWYRGYLIAPAFMGYVYEHPAFDPENASDRRMGHGNSVQECRDEIDELIEERTSDHPAWIDARALEIAQAIAAEQKITDVQTIARIQIGAIEGIKSVLLAKAERAA